MLSSCVVNIGNGRTCLLSVPFDMTSLASIEAYTGKCPSHDGLTAILDDVRSVNGDVVEGGGDRAGASSAVHYGAGLMSRTTSYSADIRPAEGPCSTSWHIRAIDRPCLKSRPRSRTVHPS